MNINGKLIQLLPVQSGTGKNGTWKKQDIIIETEGQYPKKVCISIWGDKMNINAFQIGEQVNVFFDIESREFNGKWYTDVKAWKLEPIGASGRSSDVLDSFPAEEQISAEPDDELPF